MEAQLRQFAIDSGKSMKQLAVETELPYASVYNFMKLGRSMSTRSASALARVLNLKLVQAKRPRRKG